MLLVKGQARVDKHSPGANYSSTSSSPLLGRFLSVTRFAWRAFGAASHFTSHPTSPSTRSAAVFL